MRTSPTSSAIIGLARSARQPEPREPHRSGRGARLPRRGVWLGQTGPGEHRRAAAGRVGMAIVSAAGPIANVIVAVVAAILYRVLDIVGASGFALDVFYFIVFFNLLLAIFNLIPIPPLDGYNAVLAFLPPRNALMVQRYASYGIILLLVCSCCFRTARSAPAGHGGPADPGADRCIGSAVRRPRAGPCRPGGGGPRRGRPAAIGQSAVPRDARRGPPPWARRRAAAAGGGPRRSRPARAALLHDAKGHRLGSGTAWPASCSRRSGRRRSVGWRARTRARGATRSTSTSITTRCRPRWR